MTKLAMPPSNPALFVVLGIGAWWFLTQQKARATTTNPAGVRSPAGTQFFRSPSLVGDSLQRQAQQAGLNGNAIGGLLGSILNSRLLGGSGPLQPSLVNEAARAAVRAGDSYYTAPPPPPSTSGTAFAGTGDFARMDRASYTAADTGVIDSAAARAAVRFGDPYYGSNDGAVGNPIGGAAPPTEDFAYTIDAAAVNPAPGSAYSTDFFEYQVPEEIDSSNYDYWG